MRNAKRPVSARRLFLRFVRDEVITPEELVKRCNVKPHELSRWLASKPFRRELAKSIRVMRRRLHLELELGRMCGARKLTTTVGSRDLQQARLASLNLVTLGRIVDDVCRKTGRLPPRGGRHPEIPSPLPANVPPEEAERLLDELEFGSGKEEQATSSSSG